MNTNISENDLGKLAQLSCHIVQGIDFPKENGGLEPQRDRFLALLDDLDTKYFNNQLLFDARVTLTGRPVRKLDVYTLARKIVRMARKQEIAVNSAFTGPFLPSLYCSPIQSPFQTEVMHS